MTSCELGHSSKEVRVVEGLQRPAYWEQGPGQEIHRRLERGLLLPAELGHKLRQ